MCDQPRLKRPIRLRTSILSGRMGALPIVAGVALLLAACGGAAAPASSAPPASVAASPVASAASPSAKPAASDGTSAARKPAASGTGSAAAGSASSKPAASPSVSAAAKPAASGLTHIKIGYTSMSTGGLYAYVGRDLGIFAKHGLDVELVIGQSAALPPALVKGDLDFMGTIPGAIQGAEQGLPIRGIMVAKDHPEYLLVGDNGVSQVSQLKGKELVGSLPTQLPAQMLTQLLTLDGLQPSDYKIISVSDDNARAALVAEHRVAAGIRGLSKAFPLIDQGHPQIDSTLEKVFNPSNGLAANLDNIKNRKELIQRTVDAALEATQVTRNDKDATVGVLVKVFKQTPENAARLFDMLIPTYTTNGRANPDGVKFQLKTDAAAMQLPQPKTEADVYDWEFVPGGKS
jgi:ABC-type nitrate/sulfonate/bicarbonate transport system substrate-binding protein